MMELEKEFRSQITSRAEDYENNYVRRDRYEFVVTEKDELLNILKMKVEERDNNVKEANNRLAQCCQERDEALQSAKEINNTL